MSKKFLLVIFVLLIILLSIPKVAGIKSSGTTTYDEKIEPNAYFGGPFSYINDEKDMSDEVDVEFTSNIPVNLYIFESGDLNIDSPVYFRAEYSELRITDSEFTYYLKENESYWIVISNPNTNLTASFSCKITEYYGQSEEDDDEDEVPIFGSWAMLIAIIVVAVIVIIIAVIYFIIKTRKDHERDYRSFFREPPNAKPYDRIPPQQQYSHDDYYMQQRPPEPPYKKY